MNLSRNNITKGKGGRELVPKNDGFRVLEHVF
jgi:hypothetical protein